MENDFEIFLYDTKLLTCESDDPLTAVVYHYPRNLSEDDVLFTAGQLVGMCQFYQTSLGEDPKEITLTNGEFRIGYHSRLILFVGNFSVDRDMKTESIMDLKTFIEETFSMFFGSLFAFYDQERSSKEKKYLPLVTDSCVRAFKKEIELRRGELDEEVENVLEEIDYHFRRQDVTGYLIRLNDSVIFSTLDEIATKHMDVFDSENEHAFSRFQPEMNQKRLPRDVSVFEFDSEMIRYKLNRTKNNKSPVESIEHFDTAVTRKTASSRSLNRMSKTLTRHKENCTQKQILNKTIASLLSLHKREEPKLPINSEKTFVYKQRMGKAEVMLVLNSFNESQIREFWNTSLFTLPRLVINNTNN